MSGTTNRRHARTVTFAALAIAATFPLVALAAGGTSAAPTSTTATQAATPPGDPGLGVFYVNGQKHKSNWSDNRSGPLPTRNLSTTYYQARVTYLRPENTTKPNIVLVPGYGLAADIWMTTPDVRQGWAQQLYAEGYPVYVMSPPDRGESMPIDQINKCLAGAGSPKQCSGNSERAYYGQVGKAALETSWPTWRFGPEYGKPYPDSQFPSMPLKDNYIEQFGASFVPYLGTSDIDMVDNVVMNQLSEDALTALLEEIGPSVVVLHSAAGSAGYTVAMKHPELVSALVAIETTKCPPNVDGTSPLDGTPFVGVWGDHITKESKGGHWVRRESCQKMAATIQADGKAPAEVISLPDVGIKGNSHMMMQDKNNMQILGLITDWLDKNGI